MRSLLASLQPDPAASAPPPQRYLKRAGLFAAGLLMLWVALQLMPAPGTPALPERTPTTPIVAETPASEATVSETTVSEPVGAGSIVAKSALPTRGAPSVFGPGMLVVVALLLGGGALALVLRQRASHEEGGGLTLRVVGQLQFAPSQQLRLVACGDEVLLLGVTSGQITLLKSFPADRFAETASPAEPHAAEPAAPTTASDFAQVLQRFRQTQVHAQ